MVHVLTHDTGLDPVVTLCDEIIRNAILRNASDIHLEPMPDRIRVRYRVDGVLHDQTPVFSEQGVIVRLKVLANLDIAEHRVPQDGNIRIQHCSRHIDLRVSTFPCIHGEKMVLRILDRTAMYVSLDALGCSEQVLTRVHACIQKQSGFLVVAGPTGSGKTTTLYAMLARLHNPAINVVTMEDPVEYHIEGITQSQINEKAQFSFQRGLRAILRQDPDVVMVGEMRDVETASIAVEAALTGHLILSTVHANDSVGVVTRLIDMGIKPFLLASSLTAVLAQRLVRLLCPCCKYKDVLHKREKHFVQAYGIDLQETWRARGCHACFELGYKGRTGLFELLIVDDVIRALMLEKSTRDQFVHAAVAHGMNLLVQDGIHKVIRGQVSLAEVMRVAG